MKITAWIMLIFVFTLFALLTVSVLAAEAVLTDEEKMQCRLGGGCLFITQDALLSQLKQAHDIGRHEGEAQCKKPMT